MAEAEFFHDAGYPVPGHGKVWFAQTNDGARLRFASWHPTVRPEKGTVLIAQGRAEFIERYSETIAELRRRGFLASGISRTRSIWSRPFSRLAPVTWT